MSIPSYKFNTYPTVSLRNEFIDQGIFASSIKSLGDLLYARNNAMFWTEESVPLKDSHLVKDADIDNFKIMVMPPWLVLLSG